MFKLRTNKTNRIVVAFLSIATIGAALASTSAPASAFPVFPHHKHHHNHGWGGWGPYAAGGLALGIIGASAYNGGGYGYGRICRVQRQFDEDGNYIGRARVCRRAYMD